MGNKVISKLPAWMRTGWKYLVGILLLVVFIAWAGGLFRPKIEPGQNEAPPGFPMPGQAKTLTVRPESVATRIDVVGTVHSEERVHLSARLSAYVREVPASEGDAVRKGDPLVTLDDRELREQLAAAMAQLKQAETEYKRSRQLFEQGAATDQDLTRAESAFAGAKAQVERVNVMLTDTKITSPIDGVVAERRVEAGDLANPGQVLLTVYDPANMRLEAPAPVRYVERLQLGQEVTIQLERPPQPFEGRITEIVSEIDPQSRTRTVKAHIDQDGGDILPGTFGRLWVPGEDREAILVPGSAVYRVGQLEMVQVVRDGRVVRRTVKTGRPFGERVEILSGLSDGDVILTEPVTQQG